MVSCMNGLDFDKLSSCIEYTRIMKQQLKSASRR